MIAVNPLNPDAILPSDIEKRLMGDKVKIFSDTEGGNIRLYQPSGNSFWELDAYNGNLRLFYYDADNSEYTMPFTIPKDGTSLIGKSIKATLADHLTVVRSKPVTVTESVDNIVIDLTGSVPSDYTILCPFAPSTNGFIGSPYIAGHNSSTATIYWSNKGEGTITCEILCIK